MFDIEKMCKMIEDFFKETGATQAELAEASGVSRARINSIVKQRIENVQFKTYRAVMDGMNKIRAERKGA